MPSNASNKRVTYKVWNPSFAPVTATINSNGFISAKNISGPTYITITSEDGGFTKSILVNVSSSPAKLQVASANASTKNYVNTTINNNVFGTGVYAERVQRNLGLNKAVVFFFEGAGANTSTSIRHGALCVVVKNDSNGKPYIAFENAYCTTIPDYPTDKTKNENRAMPAVIDGIYNILYVTHGSTKYDALNIYPDAVVRFDGTTKYKSTSGGINIHRRSDDGIKHWNNVPNSSGCFLVGLVENSKYTEYNKFIDVVGARNKSWGTDLGIVIVDRSQATSYLLSLYNNDSVGVGWIQGK
jgi:hypothetical protein